MRNKAYGVKRFTRLARVVRCADRIGWPEVKGEIRLFIIFK